MIGAIILVYIAWAVASLCLCLYYDPERLLKDFGKGIYIVITLPWQILAWIYEPIRRVKYKIQMKRNRKRGKHSHGYKKDKFDYKW